MVILRLKKILVYLFYRKRKILMFLLILGNFFKKVKIGIMKLFELVLILIL